MRGPRSACGILPPSPYSPLPPATAANLLEPMGVAVDALGDLYIADTGHDRVLEYDRP